MEVLDLKNEPVLFLPLSVISDHLFGKRGGSGINLDIASNGFFRYLATIAPDEENLSLALSISSDRADLEPGIVLVTEGKNLAVISEKFFADDGHQYNLPCIFNATLEGYTPGEDKNYYRAYCRDSRGGYAGEVNIVHNPAENVLWNDEDAELFRDPW